MLRTLSLALLAGGLVTVTPTSTSTNFLNGRQNQEPCAELNNGPISAERALACLRSVPLQPTDKLSMQLSGLRTFVQFQSDLDYLSSEDFPARLYPSVDILNGLNTLESRLNDGFYGNEYDFQLDISRLFASGYDGHLAYVADIVEVFEFRRVESGSAYRLVSVSEDGTAVPEIFSAGDSAALAGFADYEASSISEINGEPVDEYLSMEAAMTGVLHDPDANFNRLFQRSYAQGTAAGAFAIPGYPFFGTAEDTVLTFSNGTTQDLQTVAASVIDLDGISDGEEFFQRCCGGNPVIAGFSDILEQIEQVSATGPSALEEPKNRMKALVGPTIATVDTNEGSRLLPHLGGPHVTRQADITEGDGFSDTVISTEDGTLIGSFPESEPDLAVLALTSFAVGYTTSNGSLGQVDFQVVEDYQRTLESFLESASEAGKTRLIIDLRGNSGGLGYLPHQIFRILFPDEGIPYQGSNFRAQELFDFAGQTITNFFTTPMSALLEDLRPTLGVFGLDASQQLDESDSAFASWSEFFGPVQVPSIDANFTNIVQTDYTDPEATRPINLTRPLRSQQQVFEAENIVLLQDGVCASACALFTEFMKTDAPRGPVRQVVVGGRSQAGPMQGVGGVKGGQLAPMLELGIVLLSGITLSPQTLTDFRDDFGRNTIPEVVEALNRSSTNAAINYRNSIREDDSSVTPLQYVYEAAECRIFYTPAMLGSQDALWQRVYGVAFGGEDGACVEGSTGHPSAGAGTDFEDVEVPENAASTVGIALSDVSNAGSGQISGGADQGSVDEEDEESGAARARVSTAGLLMALVFYLLV